MQQSLIEKMYYYMCLTRAFDQKAIYLQRTGRLGTFPSSKGQEGLFVGLGLAMASKDCLCPYYRDQGALFARGASLERLLAYWGGMELGNDLGLAYDMPISVPIASQTTYACGIAFAAKFKSENKVVFCTLGDGATSKGDFYEALNFAAIHKLALVFVINNNQFAISTPLAEQSPNADLSEKGLSFGIPGHSLLGNDIITIYEKMQQLRQLALTEGPQIIAIKTYRMHDHTTADDAQRYLPENYLTDAEKYDPILALAPKICAAVKTKQAQIIETKITAAVDNYLALNEQDSAFTHTFANMPKSLVKQQQFWEEEYAS